MKLMAPSAIIGGVIIIHRLCASRSHRILWLMEELGPPYMLGDELTAADIQMWFVIPAASARQDFCSYSMLGTYLDQLEARPAFAAAVARGGSVEMHAA